MPRISLKCYIRGRYLIHNEKQLPKAALGFTLIELLVSISILAILSVAGYSTYTQSQIIARDTRRKQDLRSLATALELYYQANKTYPLSNISPCNTSTSFCSSTNTVSTWIPGLDTQFLNSLPIDQKDNSGTPWVNNNYGYAYWSGTASGCPAAGQWYVLVTQLENKNDPERFGVTSNKGCNGLTLPNSISPSNSWSNYNYIITP